MAYPDPYFSKDEDVPKVAREFGGKRFVLLGSSLKHLPEFGSSRGWAARGLKGNEKAKGRVRRTKQWEWSEPPLTRIEAEDWLENEAKGEWHIPD